MAAVDEASKGLVIYKVAVLGAGTVGKSALTLQFVHNVFVKDYDPTIEDAYKKVVNLGEESVSLDILDTAGQDDYVALRSGWTRDRDGFVLVFSLVDKASLEALRAFYDQIVISYEGKSIPPIVLVGNKSDLPDHAVSAEEAQAVANKYGAHYMETSALEKKNVDQTFENLAARIYLAQKERKGKKAGGPAAEAEQRKKEKCIIS